MEKKISNWELQMKKNTIRLMIWTFAWTLSVALVTFGPKFLWDSNTAFTVMALLVNLGLGAGLIISNKLYLDGLDEMQKKIQLEATALTLGVGLVGGIAYSLLDTTNLISSDAEISYLIILMGLTYITTIIIGQLRYR